MGARVYAPTVGRFLEVDPVSGGSATAYDYASADPINMTDLFGQSASCGPGVSSIWSKLLSYINFDKIFGSACDYHDACYTWWGTWRTVCDHHFFDKLTAICSHQFHWYDPRQEVCHSEATGALQFVVHFGWPSFMGGFVHGGQIATCKRTYAYDNYGLFWYLWNTNRAHAMYDTCFTEAFYRSDYNDAWPGADSPYGGWPQ